MVASMTKPSFKFQEAPIPGMTLSVDAVANGPVERTLSATWFDRESAEKIE